MDKGLTRTKRLMLWVGHYCYQIFVVVYLATFITSIPSPSTKPSLGWHFTWGTLASVLINAAYIGLIMSSVFRHDTGLCERCIADMPLDGPARAEKYRRSLGTYHSIPHLILLIAVLILFFASPWLGLLRLPAIAAFMVVNIHTCVLAVRHRRLEPWCPWCHWGHGGDEEFVPDPDPDPAGSIQH